MGLNCRLRWPRGLDGVGVPNTVRQDSARSSEARKALWNSQVLLYTIGNRSSPPEVIVRTGSLGGSVGRKGGPDKCRGDGVLGRTPAGRLTPMRRTPPSGADPRFGSMPNRRLGSGLRLVVLRQNRHRDSAYIRAGPRVCHRETARGGRSRPGRKCPASRGGRPRAGPRGQRRPGLSAAGPLDPGRLRRAHTGTAGR